MSKDYYKNIQINVTRIEDAFESLVEAQINHNYDNGLGINKEFLKRNKGKDYLYKIFGVRRETWSRIKSDWNVNDSNAIRYKPTKSMNSKFEDIEELEFLFNGSRQIADIDAGELKKKAEQTIHEMLDDDEDKKPINGKYQRLLKKIKMDNITETERWEHVIEITKQKSSNEDDDYDYLMRFLFGALTYIYYQNCNGVHDAKVLKAISELKRLELGDIEFCSDANRESLYKILDKKFEKVKIVYDYKNLK